jgi:Ran GTPase-activating protein (RanGAP) involved in mRNA processing and transport
MSNIYQQLNLSFQQMGDKECQALYTTYRSTHNIISLILEKNNITDAGCEFLKKIIVINPGLKILNLSRNLITSVGADILLQAFSMKEQRLLKEINFSHNNIGDEGCKSLHKFLHLGKIYTLNLSNCEIGNTGMLYLCKMLRKDSCAVKHLLLQHNKISDDGCGYISKKLIGNKHLSSLDLSSNLIGDEGCKNLVPYMNTNSNLASLILSHNRITTKGCGYIAKGLHWNTGLKSVDLQHNFISNQGAYFLSISLEKRPKMKPLVEIQLFGNTIGVEESIHVKKCLQRIDDPR